MQRHAAEPSAALQVQADVSCEQRRPGSAQAVPSAVASPFTLGHAAQSVVTGHAPGSPPQCSQTTPVASPRVASHSPFVSKLLPLPWQPPYAKGWQLRDAAS
jgi:predicted TIM-barrel enzyme